MTNFQLKYYELLYARAKASYPQCFTSDCIKQNIEKLSRSQLPMAYAYGCQLAGYAKYCTCSSCKA